MRLLAVALFVGGIALAVQGALNYAPLPVLAGFIISLCAGPVLAAYVLRTTWR